MSLLPFELVNRVLYFASIHNDKKYIPEFDKTGKLQWKLNFKHTMFDRLVGLYTYRALNRVKDYTRVWIVPSFGMTDLYTGRAFPLCQTATSYSEFLSLEHIGLGNGSNDVWPNGALITYSKPTGMEGNCVFVNGTLYSNMPFGMHGDMLPALVDIDTVRTVGNENGTELVLGVNTSQYWQFNPVLMINEYIINVGLNMEDGPEENEADADGSMMELLDTVEWDDESMETIAPHLIGFGNGNYW